MNTSPAVTNDFSQGSVPKTILRLALPMTLAQLINLLYSIVDRIYLGRMPGDGSLALAGVGLAFPVIAVVTAFSNLCSTGGAPLCSIARGAGDNERARRIMGNSYSLLLLLSVVITLVGLIFKKPLLYLVGASDATFPYANDYLSIYLFGTVFAMCGLGMNSFINAQGFARTGMLTVLLGAVVNIILDPIFIFALDMGVKGAALATVIAQASSALWVLLFLRSKKAILRLDLSAMRLRWDIVRRTLALGLSGFTMAMTNSAVSIVYNSTLQALGGDIYVSVMTVIHSMGEIASLPSSGLSQGAQPVISFNYGAGRNDRVRQAMLFVTFTSIGVCFLSWALIMLLPSFFIRIFNSDPALLEAGVHAIRIYYAVFFMMALQSVGQCGFVALGRTKQAIFFSILRKGIIVIPCIYLLGIGLNLGVDGVFMAEPISHIIGGTACFVTFMVTVWPTLRHNPDRLEDT